MDEREDRLPRMVRMGRLLDIYGGLISDRQQEFLRLHYEEDLSFSEIGEQAGVSRQAAYDAVRQGEQALNRHEERLGLLALAAALREIQDAAERINEAILGRRDEYDLRKAATLESRRCLDELRTLRESHAWLNEPDVEPDEDGAWDASLETGAVEGE